MNRTLAAALIGVVLVSILTLGLCRSIVYPSSAMEPTIPRHSSVIYTPYFQSWWIKEGKIVLYEIPRTRDIGVGRIAEVKRNGNFHHRRWQRIYF